jgi:asparagine synthase (glutamine-hydrolysing)
MCGIAGIFGQNWEAHQLQRMVESQHRRGPDATGTFINAAATVGLGHNRLSILDLSEAGRQPLSNHDGTLHLVFNGEIYNYRELRQQLCEYPYRSQTDSEVILAAYERWGEACLTRLLGMFAFLLWDERKQQMFAARDRFGVKPLYYATLPHGPLLAASEIKALHAGGLAAQPNQATWATYLAYGFYDHTEQTFWQGAQALPPGHSLRWRAGSLQITQWYDLADSAGQEFDQRPLAQVQEEYHELLVDSVRLRFRSDRPVGINLSGGLDSAILLSLVQQVQGVESNVKAFTFTTGDPAYDELPWVQQMLAHTQHPSIICQLQASEVPVLAEAVQAAQDEPFCGVPTLAYAKLYEQARREGVIVLLDGQGLDEQWCGYDYYLQAAAGPDSSLIQGTSGSPVRPECLTPEFRAVAQPFSPAQPFPDRLRNLQYRDARFSKLPRALRFNDRISMRVSTELREPFLDHRLFELALRQPPERKIQARTGKWFLRELAQRFLPGGLSEAPKRALQTPQREWLGGPLREWVTGQLALVKEQFGGSWLQRGRLDQAWQVYLQGEEDCSFHLWQWISLALCHSLARNSAPASAACIQHW